MKTTSRQSPVPTLTSFFMVLFFLVGLMACKKDSDPVPASTGVEGNWQITAITVSPAQNGISDLVPFINAFAGNDCFLRLTLTFKDNGAIDTSAPSDCVGAETTAQAAVGISDATTWKIKDNKLVLTTGQDVSEYTLEVNASTMNLVFSEKDPDDGINYTYTLKFKRV